MVNKTLMLQAKYHDGNGKDGDEKDVQVVVVIAAKNVESGGSGQTNPKRKSQWSNDYLG